ncbi:MAG: hypothetical protein PHT12_04520 [Patescibacteria group bacterium]|nr:hypothetical protein [Patescibacteria group bacterium]
MSWDWLWSLLRTRVTVLFELEDAKAPPFRLSEVSFDEDTVHVEQADFAGRQVVVTLFGSQAFAFFYQGDNRAVCIARRPFGRVLVTYRYKGGNHWVDLDRCDASLDIGGKPVVAKLTDGPKLTLTRRWLTAS